MNQHQSGIILELSGDIQDRFELTWNETLDEQIINSWQDNKEATEYGATAIVRELKNKDLEIIPYRGLPIISHWNLIWLKSKKLSPAAKALLEFVETEKERIIKETFDWFEQY